MFINPWLHVAGMGGYPVAVEPRGLWERDWSGCTSILRVASGTHPHERVNLNIYNNSCVWEWKFLSFSSAELISQVNFGLGR